TPIGAGPNSKTTRSKPGLWAARIAVTWACAASLPPFCAGQVSATVALDATVGLGLADGVAVAVGEGRAVVGLADGGAGAVDAGGRACGAQPDATTRAIRSANAGMRRMDVAKARSLTETAQCVEIPYKKGRSVRRAYGELKFG